MEQKVWRSDELHYITPDFEGYEGIIFEDEIIMGDWLDDPYYADQIARIESSIVSSEVLSS
jgi:hypothetical protein